MSGFILGLAKPTGELKKLFHIPFEPEMEKEYSKWLTNSKVLLDNNDVITYLDTYGYDKYTIVLLDDTPVLHIWVAFPESDGEFENFKRGCLYENGVLIKR